MRGEFAILSRFVVCVATAGLAIFFSHAYAQTYAPSESRAPLYIVIDGSGSMARPLGGATAMDAAASIAREVVGSTPAERPIGLISFGGKGIAQCASSGALVEAAPKSLNADRIFAALSNLAPMGRSAIVASVETAIAALHNERGEILVITDGVDTCGRNMCEIAEKLRLTHSPIRIRVKAVGPTPQADDELGCLNIDPVPAAALSVSPPPTVPISPRVAQGDFWAAPTEITWWTLANSNMPVAVVGALLSVIFGLIFKSQDDRNKKLQKKVETATDEKDAAEDVVRAAKDAEVRRDEIADEIATLENANVIDVDFRKSAKVFVERATAYLEHVAKADPDRRHHRTYEKIPRYDYTVLATALNERSKLAAEKFEAAVRIFSIWQKFAKGRAANKPVPKQVDEFLQAQVEILTN